ncbi:glycosyltransferase family 2 protein [Agromyces humi]|uniref:glycosyltransferase family 2 protein n=1 Tax=Agromyces humi TaxID=1766800 RepID=UPI00135CCB1D|nr:glycosyltransferase family 2 protein [Agromyces humi]
MIPSYNDLPLLTACLESIEETCQEFEYEVIIVDDYVDPVNSAALLRLQQGRVRVILKERRQGFAGAVNVGMTMAKHDIVLLNSDIVAKGSWLDALQQRAYAGDGVGLVSPKLVYPDGRIQYAGTYYARVLAPQWFGHLHVGAPANKPAANVPGFNRSISGACVYITRQAFDVVGLLDEEYWLGFEDVDYGLRAWQRGVRCYYEPAAMLVHHESASRGYSQGARELASMRFFWARWEHLFMQRWGTDPMKVDYLISDAAPALWGRYVDEQCSALRALGRDVTVRHVPVGTIDESIVSELQARDSVKIACDWGASTTAWLTALEHGSLLYLLPGMETIRHGGQPDLQARIVSHYRPEFDYIAPNRWSADQLRLEAAWEVQHRVVPAMSQVAVSDGSGDVVCVGSDEAWCHAVDAVAREAGREVTHIRTSEIDVDVLEAVASASASVVVSSVAEETSLGALQLLGSGAALVTVLNDRLRYEVLDGYNALTIGPGDMTGLRSSVEVVLSDDRARSELCQNGRMTADRHRLVNPAAMSRVLEHVASTPI